MGTFHPLRGFCVLRSIRRGAGLPRRPARFARRSVPWETGGKAFASFSARKSVLRRTGRMPVRPEWRSFRFSGGREGGREVSRSFQSFVDVSSCGDFSVPPPRASACRMRGQKRPFRLIAGGSRRRILREGRPPPDGKRRLLRRPGAARFRVLRAKKIPPPGNGRRDIAVMVSAATCSCCGTRTDADRCRTSSPCSSRCGSWT